MVHLGTLIKYICCPYKKKSQTHKGQCHVLTEANIGDAPASQGKPRINSHQKVRRDKKGFSSGGLETAWTPTSISPTSNLPN